MQPKKITTIYEYEEETGVLQVMEEVKQVNPGETDPAIEALSPPTTFKQAILNWQSNGTRVLNSIILFFGLLISPFIIFSANVKSQTEWMPFKITSIGLDTMLPGAFILWFYTILVSIGIVQSNNFCKMLLDWMRRKIEQ